jgi:hypothetical protein
LKLYRAVDFYSGIAVQKSARLPAYLTFVVDLFGISGERPVEYSASVLRRVFINPPSVLILSLMHFSKYRQAAQVTRLTQCNTGVRKKGLDSSLTDGVSTVKKKGYGMDGRGTDIRFAAWTRDYLYSTMNRPALWPS